MNLEINCEGCNLNRTSSLVCPTGCKPEFIDKNKKFETCPCATCLLKGICLYHCPAFNDFINEWK